MRHVHTAKELARAWDEVEFMLKKDVVVVLKKTSMDAFNELIRRSAKDTGFLRSNWGVLVDSDPANKSIVGDKNKIYPDASYVETEMDFNSMVHIYNNTEYAIYLENGTHKMSAQPMIEPTSRSTQVVLDNVSKSLTKKYYDV